MVNKQDMYTQEQLTSALLSLLTLISGTTQDDPHRSVLISMFETLRKLRQDVVVQRADSPCPCGECDEVLVFGME